MAREEHEVVRLHNEIKALKDELENARMKNVVLETMVDVAEKELEIPIRKKYGAKQSGK
jgi:predicted  nucleic acid-binding Zn-ribbon protein